MPTEPTPALQAWIWIKHAAFEAAYLEMNPPDPASSHFARRSAEHEEPLQPTAAVPRRYRCITPASRTGWSEPRG